MRIIFSLVLLFSTVFYTILAFKLKFISGGVPGEGFLPGITGITLVLLTSYNFLKEIKVKYEESFEKSNLKDFIKLVIVGVVYIFLFNILGAIISTLLFILLTLAIVNPNKSKQNIIVCLSVTFCVFLMFDFLLDVNLPIGIFEYIS